MLVEGAPFLFNQKGFSIIFSFKKYFPPSRKMEIISEIYRRHFNVSDAAQHEKLQECFWGPSASFEMVLDMTGILE